jgi:hypothetical protein
MISMDLDSEWHAFSVKNNSFAEICVFDDFSVKNR